MAENKDVNTKADDAVALLTEVQTKMKSTEFSMSDVPLSTLSTKAVPTKTIVPALTRKSLTDTTMSDDSALSVSTSSTKSSSDKEPTSPKILMTPELNTQRRRNADVFLKELQAGILEKGKWVSYSDGKLVRTAPTRAEAVTGLSLGYYCTLVGRDPSKVTILLTEGQRRQDNQMGDRYVIPIMIQEEKAFLLVDTGSPMNCILPQFARQLGLEEVGDGQFQYACHLDGSDHLLDFYNLNNNNHQRIVTEVDAKGILGVDGLDHLKTAILSRSIFVQTEIIARCGCP